LDHGLPVGTLGEGAMVHFSRPLSFHAGLLRLISRHPFTVFVFFMFLSERPRDAYCGRCPRHA
jgi:hypothetical protein